MTRGVPKCQICCVLGLLFVLCHFSRLYNLPVLSPLSSPTSPLSHCTPPLHFPKQVNKKLSCCGQNALSVIKHERNNDSEHNTVLSVRVNLDWPDA